MSRLRRYNSTGHSYFITSVTHGRRPILVKHADLVFQAITATKQRADLNLVAWIILPEHLHLILDPLSSNLSDIMKRVKQSFSMNYRKRTGHKGRVWQLRFWDHIIRNQDDLNRHLDYIHYNPVKHNLVEDPLDYSHSSIHRFTSDGYYRSGWGVRERLTFDGDYGE